MTSEVWGASGNRSDSARIIARNELGVDDTEFGEIGRRTRKQRALRLLSRAVLIAGLFIGSFVVGYLLAKRNDPNHTGYPFMVLAAAPMAARGVRRPSPMWWMSILAVLTGFVAGLLSYAPMAPNEYPYGVSPEYSVVSGDDMSACTRRS